MLLLLLIGAGLYLSRKQTPSRVATNGFDNKMDMVTENLKVTEYLDSINNKETGLFESFVGSAHFIEDVRFPQIPMMRTADGYLDNQAFTYDQALCLIAMIHMGQLDRTKEILKVYESNFMIPKNGKRGLFTSYMADKFDYYFPSPSGEFNTMILGIDGDRIHVGPAVWIGLAAQHYYFRTRASDFIDFTVKMFLWARSMPHYTLKDGSNGSIAMGYGWGAPWEKIYSTENILDYYAFLKNLLAMVEQDDERIMRNLSVNNLGISDIEEEVTNTENWFQQIGYNKRGTFSRGGFGPTEDGSFTIDQLDVLDVNSWAFSAIGPETMDKLGFDPFLISENTEKRFGVSVIEKGKKYSGFDFGAKESYSKRRDESMIWWEGTGHMAVAYKLLAEYAQKKGDENLAYWLFEKHKFYLDEMTRFSDDLIQRDSGRLPYVSKLIKDKEISYVFDDWWPIARSNEPSVSEQKITPVSFEGRYVISIASTLWRYFGAAGLNPFDATESDRQAN